MKYLRNIDKHHSALNVWCNFSHDFLSLSIVLQISKFISARIIAFALLSKNKLTHYNAENCLFD